MLKNNVSGCGVPKTTFPLVVTCLLFASTAAWCQTSAGQSPGGQEFKLALPNHPGQLQWKADGFTVVESSAKANGQEIGIRAADASKEVFFLGFLFLNKEEAPMTSSKCRDGILAEEKKNPRLKVLTSGEIQSPTGLPVTLLNYAALGTDGKMWHSARGFVATGDICGDLEFYSQNTISTDDLGLRKTFESFGLDPEYMPQFKDTFTYAQILYVHQMYNAAGPIFEQALAKLPDDESQRTMRRVTTDQAGMSYGIAGNVPKARAIFEAAIAKDPDYPLYYYNLACADAEEKKLADARTHLQQAFARKNNVLPGETFPDPTKDDSFLPYKNNKEFWTFLENLR